MQILYREGVPFGKYEGEFFMGNWHGKGVILKTDGSFKYEGEFENMTMTGYGTMTVDGVTRTGNWKDGVFQN